eukprot:6158229-Pleurochrysis_carterae.AAC.1
MREALERAGAGRVTFAQCALVALTRKYTTVAHSRGLGGGCGRWDWRSARTDGAGTRRSHTVGMSVARRGRP